MTPMVSAGAPSTREMLCSGPGSRRTSATSPMVAGAAGSGGSISNWPGISGCSCGGASCSALNAIGSAAISSADCSSVPACTASVRSPSVIEPAAISTPLCWSVSVMVCGLSPRSASASRFGWIVMRSGRAPLSCASRTPSMSESSGTATRSTRSAVDCRSSPSAGVTAIWITGKSSIVPESTWVSAASGRVCEMRLIARSTFCSVAARSTP